ncbi:hypothetical protein ASPZODRAFT_85970 [Penicilliopsis zonata CBS 506.65]|uniref:Protein kinase domain-containing protein n=1 Tax=Penicilliopsis zonata CBS 506.65 TaxID=1073090 RepID=A0A1L9STU6_9EURO|nr:hypothetical protein ASPZODRAFT_85970 [Penicilliopsis zonata CBS 506.65]OJJ50541.1 hypothetical protein ASPZODRAFT_85970 [Penicilliopsis zonata CBS 506.65]
MSVLRHGGSYLQRRLTKMYTDTKTSCESVTTASKVVDDPELVALHRSFRTQRDRLLAWGLDWSDASAAQPNDIDESLTEAGFSDVVASVMSSIQELLNEAERLQHVGASELPPKAGAADSVSKDIKGSLSSLPVKTHWTDEEISRSKTLLSELCACIDTLYDLSSSRRDMSANMSSAGHMGMKRRARTDPLIRSAKMADDSVYAGGYSDAKVLHGSPVESKSHAFFQPQDNIGPSPEPVSSSMKHLHIDRSALQLSGVSHDQNLPQYEMMAASANSRAIGRMRSSASPLLMLTKEPYVSILVEFMPIMLENRDTVALSASRRMEKVQQALDQLVQNARVSHLGLLRFLGFYTDLPNARYGFVYQMPVNYFPFLRNPTDHFLRELKPKPLVALFQPGDNSDDTSPPSLETRFHLAYDLLMAALHLRSQNIVHGNINSSNILLFPGLANSNRDEVGLTEDLRHPYLTSFAHFSGNSQSPEPLSSTMYRHPDDKRNVDDEASWAYDLYSLGLVLLEIGLWTPISRLWKMKYTNAMFKQRIENVYLRKLAPKCGTAFLHMVQLCLDAPNFHLSTQPMADLTFRVPQTYHYPVLDLSEPDGTFAFSMNFLYTICKISWSCTRIDIFAAPPAEDLDDCLPLALVPVADISAAKAPVTDFKEFIDHADVPIEKISLTHFDEPMVRMGKIKAEEKQAKKRTVKKLTNVEIPQDHLNDWNFQLMPKLSKLLQKILKESAESCSATLMMTGESADCPKTTICVTCGNVKKVRAALKKYFRLDKEGWDLIVLRGDIQRSKVPRKKRHRPAKTGPEGPNLGAFSQPNLNPCYQQRPLCGASIGAFKNEEHLPPVSYGGAILVDGMPYGMTVHHMLEAPSDDEESEDEAISLPQRSSGNGPRNPTSSGHEFMHTWCEEDPDVDCDFEVSDVEEEDDSSILQDDDEFYLSNEEDSSDDDEPGGSYNDETASIGDTVGIEPGEEPRLLVTQPAVDDVHEDFFPSLEDRDDEHLASHSLGYVHASSGVRRWTRKGIKHEIDWALVKIDDHRLDPRNIVIDRSTSLSRRPHCRNPETIHLTRVARMEELGGLLVHCCGRTSGLQSGSISRAMTIVKLHGRQSFSTSFCVNGNFGVPGDSGAWVFDKATGRVCGHVLAWSEKSRTTYIAPMEVMLEDIARTLNATHVSLPGSPDESIASSYAMTQSTTAMGRPDDPHHQRRLAEQLPVDITRLNLGLDEPRLSRVGTGRGLRAHYRRHGPPLMAPPCPLEKQLA